MKKPLPFLALLLFILLFPLFSANAQVPDFKLNRTFGTPVYFPYGIALDQQNYMYVLEGYHIDKLDPAGNLVKKYSLWPDSRHGTSVDLALDKMGNMYVANTSYALVQKFNQNGELVLEFGSYGTEKGQMSSPSGIALDQEGNIYVADEGNARVQKFDSKGNFIYEYKEPQDNTTFYMRPIAVRVSKNGIVHVLTTDYRIIKLSLDGRLIDSRKIVLPRLGNNPGGENTIALDDAGNIYVSDVYNRIVHQLTPEGVYRQSFGTDEYATGRFNGTKIGLDIGANGKLYTTDRDHSSRSTIQIFNSTGALEKRLGSIESFNAIAHDPQGNYYLMAISTGTYVRKYNSFGVEINRFGTTGKNLGQFYAPVALAVDQKGNLYCLESYDNYARIQKFSSDGRFLAVFEDFGPGIGYKTFSGLALDLEGNMYVSDYYESCVRKISPTGKFLERFGTKGTSTGQIFIPKALTVDQKGNIYVADFNGERVQKFSPQGQFLTEFNSVAYPSESVNTQPASIAVDLAGNLYVWEGMGNFLRVYNPSGKEVKKIQEAAGYLSLDRYKSRLLVLNSYVVEEYLTGELPKESLITGNIYYDVNQNCSLETTDKPLSGIMVMAEPGPYYGFTDEAGNYLIPVDTGRYTVTAVIPKEVGRTITPSCSAPGNQLVKVDRFGAQVPGPDFANQVTTSPLLSVHLSSTRRRRCFQNVTTVSYSNTGFAPAYGAQITVQFPEEISIVSANMPFQSDGRGHYLFDVGTLLPHQRGIISITDSVSCADPSIRGLTVCTKAWITPANTYPIEANWNQANITVSGATSTQNQVRFVLSNNGTGDMADSLSYRVYQDQELLLKDKYKLMANDSLVLRFEPSGRTLRVEADQPQGHPIKTLASANLEIRARNNGIPALPMMALPPDDAELEITEECLPIIDSFDPNDKQVVPVGLTAEHYTPTNTPLRYTVRFQNTGTDYAYRVVVVDTLSADLDMSTFKVGAVTHPYRMTISGQERPVVTFTFDNIMLPDSARDQAGSNGAIQFSIKPKAGLPEKHLIENLADIFFDYNEPVRTNTTQNRIYDMPPVVNLDRQLSSEDAVVSPTISTLSPNASRAGTVVTISGKDFSEVNTDNKVTFNGAAAQVESATATELKVRVPSKAFSGKVKLVTPDGSTSSSGDFTIFQPPTLTSISPVEGIVGSEVTLQGDYLSPDLIEAVQLGSVNCEIIRFGQSYITVKVPAGATSNKFTIISKGGDVTSATTYKVWFAPVLSGFNKDRQRVGGDLTFQGENFAASAQRNQVLFEDKAAQVLQATETSLMVRVPAGARTGSVHVTTPGGTTSRTFEVIPAPVLVQVLPAAGSVGTVVELKGEHFNVLGEQDTVTFGEAKALVLEASATYMKVKVPRGATTGKLAIAGLGGKAEQDFKVEELTPDQAIKVYPNPSSGKFTVDFTTADFRVQAVQVFDIAGKLLYSQNHVEGQPEQMKINLSGENAGLFLVIVQTERGKVVKKLSLL